MKGRIRPTMVLWLPGIILCPAKALGATPKECLPVTDEKFHAQDADLWRDFEMNRTGALRKYAWETFWRIRSANSDLPWWRWPEKKDVFPKATQSCNTSPGARELTFERPPQLAFLTDPSDLGPLPEPLQTVHFNSAAARHICNQDQLLNDFTKLDDLRVHNQFIVPFPRDAIAVKAVWWTLTGDVTVLPVWDPLGTELPEDSIASYPFYRWKRYVAVSKSAKQRYKDVIQPPTWWREPKPQGMIDVFPVTEFHSDSSNGQTRILVGMHIASKVLDDWFWMTFWWHDKPDADNLGKDRLPIITGPWAYFLMDIAVHPTVPRDEKSERPNHTFNPWLEAKLKRGVTSNCITCHQRSAWCVEPENRDQVFELPMPPDAPFFRGKLRLDYMWSIMDENYENKYGRH